MQISEETIKRFQKIFEKDYGKKLSRQETFEAANNLVGFFDLLFKIDRRVNSQRYKSKKKI
ncbi:hypothetical protein KAT95_01030 [Candidatus Parcubacteria bacterium]|nr:hypothetical protein [Candidatus Parcubacteria bacterium]